jgi:mono/diheme cytochrome c family protein
MISARMGRRLKIAACAVAVVGGAVLLAACGSQRIKLASSSPYRHGAQLFADHCSGCHTLDVTGSEGSAARVRDRVRTNGPNFNVRCEQIPQILYAIRNGGFSGAIMPQNVVVGGDAQAVARFLARYSGLRANPPCRAPGSSPGQSGGAGSP